MFSTQRQELWPAAFKYWLFPGRLHGHLGPDRIEPSGGTPLSSYLSVTCLRTMLAIRSTILIREVEYRRSVSNFYERMAFLNYTLPSPWASLLCAADAFRVTWSDLRPIQTRRSETFCLTWGGAFGSGRAVNNFSALMKDVQQPWRVQRIKR